MKFLKYSVERYFDVAYTYIQKWRRNKMGIDFGSVRASRLVDTFKRTLVCPSQNGVNPATLNLTRDGAREILGRGSLRETLNPFLSAMDANSWQAIPLTVERNEHFSPFREVASYTSYWPSGGMSVEGLSVETIRKYAMKDSGDEWVRQTITEIEKAFTVSLPPLFRVSYTLHEVCETAGLHLTDELSLSVDDLAASFRAFNESDYVADLLAKMYANHLLSELHSQHVGAINEIREAMDSEENKLAKNILTLIYRADNNEGKAARFNALLNQEGGREAFETAFKYAIALGQNKTAYSLCLYYKQASFS